MGKLEEFFANRKKVTILLTVLALIVIAILVFGPKACAEEATQKPPAKGEWFVAASLLYTADWGGAAGAGYQFKDSGVILIPQLAYTYCPGTSGVVPYSPQASYVLNPRVYSVPYSVPSEGSLGGIFTIAIPLRKSK